MLGEIRVEAKQVNDKRKRMLHPNGHMSWFIETRLGPNTHAMTISTWWAIIGGIEVVVKKFGLVRFREQFL